MRTRQHFTAGLKIGLHQFQVLQSSQLFQRGNEREQTVDLPFMKYFKFNPFGPNCSPETSVISVDVQLKQLVIFYSEDTEK